MVSESYVKYLVLLTYIDVCSTKEKGKEESEREYTESTKAEIRSLLAEIKPSTGNFVFIAKALIYSEKLQPFQGTAISSKPCDCLSFDNRSIQLSSGIASVKVKLIIIKFSHHHIIDKLISAFIESHIYHFIVTVMIYFDGFYHLNIPPYLNG